MHPGGEGLDFVHRVARHVQPGTVGELRLELASSGTFVVNVKLPQASRPCEPPQSHVKNSSHRGMMLRQEARQQQPAVDVVTEVMKAGRSLYFI